MHREAPGELMCKHDHHGLALWILGHGSLDAAQLVQVEVTLVDTVGFGRRSMARRRNKDDPRVAGLGARPGGCRKTDWS